MVAITVVVLAVAGAIVFVMRMDEDPTRWEAPRPPSIRRLLRANHRAAATPTVQEAAASD